MAGQGHICTRAVVCLQRLQRGLRRVCPTVCKWRMKSLRGVSFGEWRSNETLGSSIPLRNAQCDASAVDMRRFMWKYWCGTFKGTGKCVLSTCLEVVDLVSSAVPLCPRGFRYAISRARHRGTSVRDRMGHSRAHEVLGEHMRSMCTKGRRVHERTAIAHGSDGVSECLGRVEARAGDCSRRDDYNKSPGKAPRAYRGRTLQ